MQNMYITDPRPKIWALSFTTPTGEMPPKKRSKNTLASVASRRKPPQLEASGVSNQSTAVPSIDQFAEALLSESDWYSLGIFLGATTAELDTIGINYRGVSIMRCLIELYKCLQSRAMIPSWEHITNCLKRMNKDELATRISSMYVKTSVSKPSSSSIKHSGAESSEILPQRDEEEYVEVEYMEIRKITEDFENLSEQFIVLLTYAETAFRDSDVNITQLQTMINCKCGFPDLLQPTFDAVFQRLKKHCSILNFRVLVFIITNLLKNDEMLQEQLEKFQEDTDRFKSSTEMIELAKIVKKTQANISEGKIVKLKLRSFWEDVTVKQFEKAASKILGTLYDLKSQIRVDEGCICISWVIPDIDTTKLVPDHSLEFIRIIGIISLHIGSDVIYNNEGEGCETIEAAMLQAIELKNTRAIELLLAMGCNPEVATYNGDNAVTTIMNIRESKKSSVDHVCIIGHNEHVEAIVDPSSKPAECSSCNMKEKMIKQLYQQNDTLHQEQTTLHSLTDQLQLTVKAKGILMLSIIYYYCKFFFKMLSLKNLLNK